MTDKNDALQPIFDGLNELVEKIRQAEGDRDVARNEALAAREARRMTEAALDTARAEVTQWRALAGERLHTLRNIEREITSCVGSLTVTDLDDHDADFAALADEPPKGGAEWE